MNEADRSALIALPILIAVGALFGLAASQEGTYIGGWPLFAMLVALAFLIQWLAFIPAFLLHTEKFFDLTGSLTYIAVVTLGVRFAQVVDARSILLWAMVVIWAMRLGAFLFLRIRRAGRDIRFDRLKSSFIQFLHIWTIQGLWVTLTAGAALAAITTTCRKGLDVFALIGLLVWAVGFSIEIVADAQKARFNADPRNAGRFIRTGLWAWSRHPNYFGEIVLWLGVTLVAAPVLRNWRLVALVSPVVVTLLLTHVSGIPLLERRADKRWGGQAVYEAYKRRTPILVPRLGAWK